MKFLADVNIEKKIIDFLRDNKFDVKWMLEDNKYLNDFEIIKIANDENRILLTNDKDFGEIVFRQKFISSGILLLRIYGQKVEKKVELLKKLLVINGKELYNNFIVIKEKNIRIIKLQQWGLNGR